jgi:phage head maturation protease
MKVKLHEVSVCTFPAYNSTELSARGADEKHIKKRRFELWRSQQEERMNKWH